MKETTKQTKVEAEELNKKGEAEMKKTTLWNRIKDFYDRNESEIKMVGFGALTGLITGAATIVGAKLTFDAINDKDETYENKELTDVDLKAIEEPKLYGEEIITEDGELVVRVVEGQ